MSEIGRPLEKPCYRQRENVYRKGIRLENVSTLKYSRMWKERWKTPDIAGELIHRCSVDYQAFSTETSGIGYLIWLRLKIRPPVRMAAAARKAVPRSIP